MNLARCLGTQPQAHLRSLALQYGIVTAAGLRGTGVAVGPIAPASAAATLSEASPASAATPSAGESLPELISAHLKKQSTLRAILDELTDDERAALKVITFAGGGSGIVMEQCHQRINQVTGRRRRNGAQVVAGLMGRGMVYVGRAKYRQFYFVPTDLQAQLAVMFGQELLERVATGPLDDVRAQSHDSYAVLRWICQFLAYTQKVQVELTQTGAIYRRTQRALLRMMGRDLEAEEAAAEQAGRDQGGPDLSDRDPSPRDGSSRDQPPGTGLHPDPLDFVFDYCRSRELCEVVDSSVVPTMEAEEWMALPLRQRREDLLAFWREARISSDVDVQAVLSVLMTLPGDTWVDLQALFREVEPMASDLFRGSLRRRLEHKVVRYLILQGLLAVGESSAGPVCRLTDLGRSLLRGDEEVDDVQTEDRFFIQPNFELLVPAHIDTTLLWRIEEIADLEKPDWMMVYRISRTSIYRALRLGRDPAEILNLLHKHALNEIPQNVAFSVRDWASAFGRIRFAQAFTLQVDTSALADELMASRAMRQYILGRLSPTVLIVDRHKHADLLVALEAEGYMPSPGIVTLGGSDPWGEPWEVMDVTADGPVGPRGGGVVVAVDSPGRSTPLADPRQPEPE